jgi:hypothetical protein
MIRWDDELKLLMADSLDEAKSVGMPRGRQVGIIHAIQDDAEEDVHVYQVYMDGVVHLTHAPDHWGLPAWYAEYGNDEDR